MLALSSPILILSCCDACGDPSCEFHSVIFYVDACLFERLWVRILATPYFHCLSLGQDLASLGTCNWSTSSLSVCEGSSESGSPSPCGSNKERSLAENIVLCRPMPTALEKPTIRGHRPKRSAESGRNQSSMRPKPFFDRPKRQSKLG